MKIQNRINKVERKIGTGNLVEYQKETLQFLHKVGCPVDRQLGRDAFLRHVTNQGADKVWRN